MPKKRPTLSKQDLDAFQEAVKGTKPLHAHQQIKVRLSPKASEKRQPHKPPVYEDNGFHLNEILTLDSVTAEEQITYKQSDISLKYLRKLRKGQYTVEAKLDLHGMTVDKARVAVEDFLSQCLTEKLRVVLIIHGKGHHHSDSKAPILKNKLNHWLRDLKDVLAFCSAAPFHGSRGAIYVLLKYNAGDCD